MHWVEDGRVNRGSWNTGEQRGPPAPWSCEVTGGGPSGPRDLQGGAGAAGGRASPLQHDSHNWPCAHARG